MQKQTTARKGVEVGGSLGFSQICESPIQFPVLLLSPAIMPHVVHNACVALTSVFHNGEYCLVVPLYFPFFIPHLHRSVNLRLTT